MHNGQRETDKTASLGRGGPTAGNGHGKEGRGRNRRTETRRAFHRSRDLPKALHRECVRTCSSKRRGKTTTLFGPRSSFTCRAHSVPSSFKTDRPISHRSPIFVHLSFSKVISLKLIRSFLNMSSFSRPHFVSRIVMSSLFRTPCVVTRPLKAADR